MSAPHGGAYSAPRPLAGFAAGGEWRGGDGRTRGGRESEKGGIGKRGERGKLWGIATWLLGG